jgi:hypothetical protein
LRNMSRTALLPCETLVFLRRMNEENSPYSRDNVWQWGSFVRPNHESLKIKLHVLLQSRLCWHGQPGDSQSVAKAWAASEDVCVDLTYRCLVPASNYILDKSTHPLWLGPSLLFLTDSCSWQLEGLKLFLRTGIWGVETTTQSVVLQGSDEEIHQHSVLFRAK